jgi:hypothetical protein
MILFDVHKRHPIYEFSFGDEEVTVKFLMKVYHGFRQIMVDFNKRKAFQALIVEFETRGESDKLFLNEEKLRQNAGLREP